VNDLVGGSARLVDVRSPASSRPAQLVTSLEV
jgi:hypothetical protein